MGCYTSKLKYNIEDINNMVKLNCKIVIYEGKIYDISHLYSIDHPGGFILIEKNIGKDITEHINFHSKKVKKMVTKKFVGYLI